MISQARIEALSKLPGVKSIAVQNFLGSLDGLTASEAHSNLKMDATLYKWNAATVRVITRGLIEHFGR